MTRRATIPGWASALALLGCPSPDATPSDDTTTGGSTSAGDVSGDPSGGPSDDATPPGDGSTGVDDGTGDDTVADSTGADGETGSTGEPLGDPLALLGEGSHVSMIVGFELPAAGTEPLVDQRWDEALEAGMDVGRVQVDWADLEPRPGEYELAGLTEQLEVLAADGLQVMVTLSTIDSLEYTVPDDLSDPDDPLALAGGIAFDDPAVTDRFSALLDVVVPVVVEHGGFLIAVGNEPDNGFEENPGFAAEVAGFTAAAKAHAATIDPQLAISMTLTYASIDTYAESGAIFDAVDVVALNMYCQDESGAVEDASMVGPKVDAIIDVVGDKPVVFQELGCPSGWEDAPTTIDGSLDKQAAFFGAVSAAMSRHPQLRAAFVFQLLDWSEDLVAVFSAELQAAGFRQPVIDFFAESLGTMGLCRYADASCRPAWDAVLEAIAAHAG